MGIYRDQVLPRVAHVTMSRPDLAPIRERVAAGLSGDIVEIGFGSGLNVPYYPREVTRVRAVDPAVVGRRLAAQRVAASHATVEYIGLDGQRLPLEAESADHVLITWTLCTVPDAGLVLDEIHRVLRPRGTLHFVEHGLSPEPRVATWQGRMNPVQGVLFGGCRLNRPIGDLVAGSKLEVSRMDTYYAEGPKMLAYLYEGVAVKP